MLVRDCALQMPALLTKRIEEKTNSLTFIIGFVPPLVRTDFIYLSCQGRKGWVANFDMAFYCGALPLSFPQNRAGKMTSRADRKKAGALGGEARRQSLFV